MPQRSNPFQQLVFLIQNQLEGQADVFESKLLIDRTTNAEREVDIVIEATVKNTRLVIGIEVTNPTSRNNDVTWVEKMAAKHRDLPIDKTILVSSREFSASARKKADFYGIQTLTVEKAGSLDWARKVADVDNLVLAGYQISATRYRVEFEAGGR